MINGRVLIAFLFVANPFSRLDMTRLHWPTAVGLLLVVRG